MYMAIFFFNDTATTEIYTLSLHDALPISAWVLPVELARSGAVATAVALLSRSTGARDRGSAARLGDRKSTRLNSSHANISYAVFCLKKKNIFCLQKKHNDNQQLKMYHINE